MTDRKLLTNNVHRSGDICNTVNVSAMTIAAGPLFKQPGTMPFRHIMLHFGRGGATGEFVVQTEFHPAEGSTAPTTNKPYLENGHYFPFSRDGGGPVNEACAFQKALECFARCLVNDAEYAKSLDRAECLVDELDEPQERDFEAQASADLGL